MYALPETGARQAPPEPILAFAAGLYFHSIVLEKGMVAGQHDHDHAHATFIGSGRVRGWKNGAWIGDKGPGEAFEIEAGAVHCFEALETSLLACTHNEESAMSLPVRSA